MNENQLDIEDILQYLDGSLSPEKVTRIEEMLLHDQDARRLVREISEQAVMSADLERVRASVRSESTDQSSQATQSRHLEWNRSQVAITLLATVAMALVMISTVQFLWRDTQDKEVITILALNGPVEWTGEGGRVQELLQVGNKLPGGTIALDAHDAWIEIGLQDGSTLTLAGKSAVTLADDGQKVVHLRSGSLSADIESQPEDLPMIVRTRVAEVTVLGTQFNMKADDLATVVAVNEGRVRVKRLVDSKVAEVPENFQVVAAASREANFEVTARRQSVSRWQSQLPAGITYGKWLPGVSLLRAAPLLWHDGKKKEQEPLLLYVAAASLNPGESSPVKLRPGAQFRICGQIEKPMDVIIGVTTQYLRGGFAGKHLAVRKADQFTNVGGEFELIVPIEEFVPQEPDYPKSAVGFGLYDLWCLTINEDAGLSIKSVELNSSSENK